MTIELSAGSLPNTPLLLLASEDQSLVAFGAYVFEELGLQVAAATCGRQLSRMLRTLTPDVLVLDSHLPDLDVRRFCGELRLEKRTRSVAVLLLLPPGDDSSEELALALGADQCLKRPFRPERLVASVRSALPAEKLASEKRARHILVFHDIELDLAAYLVRRNGRAIHLAPMEFRLLRHLMRHPGRVHSRSELQNAAWPRDIHIGGRTVDVHIGRLRQALKAAGGRDPIRTVRSVGYGLSD